MNHYEEIDHEEISWQQNNMELEGLTELAFEDAIKNGLFKAEDAPDYIFLGEVSKGFWFQNRVTEKKILSENSELMTGLATKKR